jgi:hypothetical protein
MTAPSLAMRELARRLLAERRDEPALVIAEVEEVLGRLRERLVRLVGERGFGAMLERALKLAQEEIPALGRAQVTPDGRLAGLAEALAGRSHDEAVEAPACLLAHLLELLASFIGADLTLRLAGPGPSEET